MSSASESKPNGSKKNPAPGKKNAKGAKAPKQVAAKDIQQVVPQTERGQFFQIVDEYKRVLSDILKKDSRDEEIKRELEQYTHAVECLERQSRLKKDGSFVYGSTLYDVCSMLADMETQERNCILISLSSYADLIDRYYEEAEDKDADMEYLELVMEIEEEITDIFCETEISGNPAVQLLSRMCVNESESETVARILEKSKSVTEEDPKEFYVKLLSLLDEAESECFRNDVLDAYIENCEYDMEDGYFDEEMEEYYVLAKQIRFNLYRLSKIQNK